MAGRCRLINLKNNTMNIIIFILMMINLAANCFFGWCVYQFIKTEEERMQDLHEERLRELTKKND